MGIGISIVLLAAGAILTFALEVDRADVFNLNNAGIVLMVVGTIGLLWAFLMASRPHTHARTYVEERPVRRTYEDPVQ